MQGYGGDHNQRVPARDILDGMVRKAGSAKTDDEGRKAALLPPDFTPVYRKGCHQVDASLPGHWRERETDGKFVAAMTPEDSLAAVADTHLRTVHRYHPAQAKAPSTIM